MRTLIRSIPVAALAHWVRGARAPDAGPAELGFSADGRLAALVQDGWTLGFDRWEQPPGSPVELPTRLTAERGEARVRLAIDAWQFPVPAPAP